VSDGIRVQYQDLVAAIEEALAAEGVPEQVRRIEAHLFADADLMEVPSHGVRMLPGVIAAIRAGKLNASPQPRILRDNFATCLLDGDLGLGRYISTYGMDLAIERARQYGVGLCVASRVSHWGRAHAYADQAARAGMIGICTTNAIPNMLGWNSKRPVLANNPLAISAPRGPGLDPIVLDIAMSQAAVGKIATYVREGKSAPAGWGLDAEGNPTTDPAAILASRLILPMGEHKGAGLALMMELLTGALAGGLLSHDIAGPDSAWIDAGTTKFLLAIDIEKFLPPQIFAERVAAVLAFVAEGVGEETYPGRRGWQTRARNLVDGVPIHPQIVEQLAQVGITLPALP
jgi:LDH2 family malate/lactate/ureidoglycolate dehydrogenase